jgi:hypothetical protein
MCSRGVLLGEYIHQLLKKWTEYLLKVASELTASSKKISPVILSADTAPILESSTCRFRILYALSCYLNHE